MRRRIMEQGLEQVQALRCDATTLDDIESSSVDVVYFVGLLEVLPDLPTAFANMARVLRPGGLLVGVTSNGDCPWYRLRQRMHRGERHARTGVYLGAGNVVALARAAGLAERTVLPWGACPPGLSNMAVAGVLDKLEDVVARTPLKRYLGVLSFSLQKP